MATKPIFKKKYQEEKTKFKVTAFIKPDGERTDDFNECSIVMVSPLPSNKGPSLPLSKGMFVRGTKIGHVFVETIYRE